LPRPSAQRERCGRIDIPHYNVGGSFTAGDASPLEITEEEFKRICAINLRGSGMAANHALPPMRARSQRPPA
jgi:NAD(P)-dependent dehydrogenase (short-subunit alcohol dehydrogenase family)